MVPPRSAGVAQAARKLEVPGFALAGDPRALATGERGDLNASNRSTLTRTRRAQEDDKLDPNASPEESPVERGGSCRR